MSSPFVGKLRTYLPSSGLRYLGIRLLVTRPTTSESNDCIPHDNLSPALRTGLRLYAAFVGGSFNGGFKGGEVRGFAAVGLSARRSALRTRCLRANQEIDKTEQYMV